MQSPSTSKYHNHGGGKDKGPAKLITNFGIGSIQYNTVQASFVLKRELRAGQPETHWQ